MLQSLDATEHQWYAARHQDTDRVHVHIALNRIEPIEYSALNTWGSHAKLARAAEWVEREFGCLTDRRMDWRARGLAEIDLGPEFEQSPPRGMAISPSELLTTVPAGAPTPEADGARAAGYSWTALLRPEAVPAAMAVLEKNQSWDSLQSVLRTYGVHLEKAGSGARLVGAEIGQQVKASRVGLNFADLEKRLDRSRFVKPRTRYLTLARFYAKRRRGSSFMIG